MTRPIAESEEQVPLACVPGAIPAAERPGHFERSRRLFAAVKEREVLANGYAVRFDPERLSDIALFIEHERHCCPFLAFTLELRPNGGPVWLRLTGPIGTRAFLEAELPGLSQPDRDQDAGYFHPPSGTGSDKA